MAVPADLKKRKIVFRDAKGDTSRLTVLVGGADEAGVEANYTTLRNHVEAISNCGVNDDNNPVPLIPYGVQAVYENVEDGALLTFQDPTNGSLHRYKIPAPKAAIFLADGETVNQAQADIVSLISDFETFVYGAYLAPSPLTYLAGVRVRRKMHRRMTIFTKSGNLDEPAE